PRSHRIYAIRRTGFSREEASAVATSVPSESKRSSNTFDFRIKEQDIRAWFCSFMIDPEGF
ncbi:hypothetical protein, partial [Pseudomonas folii]|uniref:hypothetical protein n=1 Tax=Pseudomonas folii TaxID=2762593 RepID=UPI001BE40247